MGEDEKDV